jgi:hypothetical protein
MTSDPSSQDRCETGQRPIDHLKDQARERLVEAKHQAKHRIDEARRDVTRETRRLAAEARERLAAGVRSGATTGIQGVCASCRDVRDALHSAADTLREKNDTRAAGCVSGAADGLDRASRYLEERSPDQLASDAGNVVRSHPGMVLGGIAALGLLTGRFLRASAHEANLRRSGGAEEDSFAASGPGAGGGFASGSAGQGSIAGGSTGREASGGFVGDGGLGGGTTPARGAQQYGQSEPNRRSDYGQEGTAI